METQFNTLNFRGQRLYVGIDVHKKDWAVCIRSEKFELKKFRQPPDPRVLSNHLKVNYPGGDYQCVYEAGFSGFWIQQQLEAAGVHCLVVHPADVPTSDKEKRRKTDKVDCRKLARELSSGNLKGIYIPDQAQLDDRGLVRLRSKLVRDQTRIKNGCKSLLHFHGIPVPEAFEKTSHWSKRFIDWLASINFKQQSAKTSVSMMVEQHRQIRKLVLESTKAIKALSETCSYTLPVKLLRSIPGVGLTGAMVILTELGPIGRFRDLDHLYSYVGLTPAIHSSGDHEYKGRMDHRGNAHLRDTIIESAWQIIRKDPVMLYCFNSYCKRMASNKAIIKVARKLLSRIRYVLTSGKPYRAGTIQKNKGVEFTEASAARIDEKKCRSTKASALTIQAG